MSDILRIEGLSKRYGQVLAVNDVSFAIPEGVCFGLLGPNGAGKTTTIEILEGILTPSSGRVLFRDKELGKDFKSKIGIQFQNTALPEFITVRETLELFSSFYEKPRTLEEVVDLCSLHDIMERDNRKLSGGQRQRMLLALAIIPKPELVFLDEPTTGLDPQARRNFWDLINKVKAEHTTIILTTHYMDEAQLLCDRIAIMDKGTILAIDTPEALLEKHFDGVLIKLPYDGCCSDALQGFDGMVIHEDYIELQTNKVDKSLRDLLSAKVGLEGLSIHKPNLEDLFIKLTGNSLRT
ncbi:MAG: ABC transporter ATP-binding protein [Spirochaetia bacterium]|jgi:ABC-2 type transport system ATP-binding protein|nr:ABC transporter ATP-binding protein [Spirochaetia bacterium]